MKTKVLIVGAGPVGLTMALELTRFGVPVRIVDLAARRTDKSKAIVLWSRSLELLDRTGCAQAFVSAGNKVTAANITTGTRVIGHVDMTTVDSPYPFALILPQSETERLLEEHLNRLGVQIERQVEAVSFTPAQDCVDSVLRQADGREERFVTDWLIGCDGAHSLVRHGLGLPFLGETMQTDWILADIHVKGYPFPETEIAIYWNEHGVLLLFPISPGRFRVIADIGQSQGEMPPEPSMEQVQHLMDERGPGGMTASDPVWLSAFRINERKVKDYRVGRVFVAGDAAHVHSPAGGQGMNTGMQDAFNLAWKLALVCNDTCSEKLLDSYSIERSAIGDMVLKAAGRLTMVAILRNHAAQVVRNFLGHILFGLAPVRHAFANNLSEVTVHYEHSPLNGSHAQGVKGPVPGDRMAPVPGQPPAGSGSIPRFVLFALPSPGVTHLIKQHPQLLDSEIRPPLDAEGMWLVRPDGYVACVAERDDTMAFADYLHSL